MREYLTLLQITNGTRAFSGTQWLLDNKEVEWQLWHRIIKKYIKETGDDMWEITPKGLEFIKNGN